LIEVDELARALVLSEPIRRRNAPPRTTRTLRRFKSAASVRELAPHRSSRRRELAVSIAGFAN
jgi:hypothetical protein